MQLSTQDKTDLNLIGKYYSAEKRYRKYSEWLLISVFVLSFLNLIFDSKNLIDNIFVFSISLIISLISLVSIILEHFSKNFKNFADEGRRIYFFKDLIDEKIIINTFTELSIKVKGLKSKRQNYNNYYYHDVPILHAQKTLNLHESIYYEYYKRSQYMKKVQIKYIIFWLLLLFIILLGMVIGSQSTRIIITNLVTIVILSSFAIETIFLVFSYDKKVSKLKNILDSLTELSDLNSLLFQFLEYTIILRNMPSIPDNFYEKIKDQIENEYKKVGKIAKTKILSKWDPK